MRLWNPSFKKCAKLKQCVQWLKKFGWHAAGSVSVQVSSGGQAAAFGASKCVWLQAECRRLLFGG